MSHFRYDNQEPSTEVQAAGKHSKERAVKRNNKRTPRRQPVSKKGQCKKR